MSHNVTVSNIKITDITSLEAAIDELRGKGVAISLHKDAHYRGYNASQSGVRPYVIRLDGSPYDIALDVDSDGNYVPVFDPWNGHVARQVGANMKDAELFQQCSLSDPRVAIGQLMQTYGVVKTEREAAMKGLSTQRNVQENGQVAVTVTGY